MKLFEELTENEAGHYMANFLASGKLFENKHNEDSNLFKLLKSISIDLIKRTISKLNQIEKILKYFSTNDDIIERFEEQYGVSRFYDPKTKDLSFRISFIKFWRSLDGAYTKKDYISIAKFLGFEIDVVSAKSIATFPITFPIKFLGNNIEANNRIVIFIRDTIEGNKYPLNFPINFSSDKSLILKKILDEIKPATTEIIYYYE